MDIDDICIISKKSNNKFDDQKEFFENNYNKVLCYGAKIQVPSSTVRRKLPMLLPFAARKEKSSEHIRASSSEYSRSISSSNCVQQQWHAAAATTEVCSKLQAARPIHRVALQGGGSYDPPQLYMMM